MLVTGLLVEPGLFSKYIFSEGKTAIHTDNFLKGKFTVQMEFFTCTKNEMFGQGSAVHTGARSRALLFIE